MSEVILNAQKRSSFGKGAARKLRAQGYVPGVYYLHNELNIPFTVEQISLNRLLRRPHALITLAIEDEEHRECIIRELQRDPITDAVLHIDLQGIQSDERLMVTVPIKLVGTPIGAKEGGILEHGIAQASIECLPKDIPEFIEVDVSNLAIGHSIHIADLAYPQFRFRHDPHTVVAHIAAPTLMKEPAAATTTEEASTESEPKTEV